MSFRVGQKVVCVNARPIDSPIFEGEAPVEGLIYTVTSNFVAWAEPHIELAEIKNGRRRGYRARRFRPLIEHKTDISVFTAMLIPKRQKTKA